MTRDLVTRSTLPQMTERKKNKVGVSRESRSQPRLNRRRRERKKGGWELNQKQQVTTEKIKRKQSLWKAGVCNPYELLRLLLFLVFCVKQIVVVVVVVEEERNVPLLFPMIAATFLICLLDLIWQLGPIEANLFRPVLLDKFSPIEAN